jgi:integrase
MATINFLYRSKRDNAPLTLRLLFRNNNNDYVFDCKTKVDVDKSYWSLHSTNTRDAQIRVKQNGLNQTLHLLEKHVLSSLNEVSFSDVDKDWLKAIVENFYNPVPGKDERVVYWIQRIVDESATRENSKGGLGLSNGRIASWKRLKILLVEFSNLKQYKVSQLDVSKFKEFKVWLINQKEYSSTYATKKLSDLKTALREAKSEGVETSTDFDKLPTKQSSAYDHDMDVITLTESDLKAIESIDLQNDALINARKWLILACYTGQRGETLTRRLNADSFQHRGKDLIIRVIQRKGNKPVQIPVLPKVKEIYENGLPYPVSTQKLNEHFKVLGQKAELTVEVMGRLEEKQKNKTRRGVKKLRPKWQYLSTHIGRRTFATLHYGVIPTPIIMAVTGHKKESTFLGYINKSDDSHINTFLDYYQIKEQKERKEPQLSVVPKTAN